jgi:hypothetical protein
MLLLVIFGEQITNADVIEGEGLPRVFKVKVPKYAISVSELPLRVSGSDK